ncbi:MAG: ArsR/SmtB family transcription factor [Microcoleaceae cyanobacterium]
MTTISSTSALTAANTAASFHAFSDPLRVQVLELLRQQELCVCELCEKLEVSQSKLSFHLKTLRDSNLIQGRQQGRWVYYSLNINQFRVLEQYLTWYCSFDKITPAAPCED